jgi:hypothetical protein
MSRVLARIPRDRVTVALAGVLGAGLALRIWFLFVWSPALVGYSDSGVYFQDSIQSVWTDPIRTVGYSMFLRVLHGISPHLIFVIIVQHLLGLLTALLYFLAVRRCGGPRGLGLAPAAIIALGGDQLFLEHSALSDSLFIFLVAAMLYCAIRASQGRALWAALAGLLAGLSVWDRAAGLVLVVAVVPWLLFSLGRPTRRTLALALLSLVVWGATVEGYIQWRHAETGLSGLSTNSPWNLYGRVAPWANCSKFTPPAGTTELCEYAPASQHVLHTAGAYIYGGSSPAVKLFGVPYLISKYPNAMGLMQKFSEAAILGQPGEYLHAVWLDTLRLFNSERHSYSDLSAKELIAFLLYGPDLHSGLNEFVTSWQVKLYPSDPPPNHGDIGPFVELERYTRIEGWPMVILLALTLAAPWLAIGRRARSGASLFAIAALLLIFFPLFANGFDFRYVISSFGPLVAAGAFGAWGLLVRLRPLAQRMRAKPQAVAPG